MASEQVPVEAEQVGQSGGGFLGWPWTKGSSVGSRCGRASDSSTSA